MCSSFILVTHLVNGAQFLNAALVSALLSTIAIPPLARIYASEESQSFDLITFVSNLMLESFWFLLSNSVLFWLLITYHFLLENFEVSLSESINKFKIFWVSIFYMETKANIAFCGNSKVISSDFSIIKNIVALSLPSLPINLILLNQGLLIQFPC